MRHDEQVRVRMPLDVVDAMLSGPNNELDLLAGLRRLSEFDGDLALLIGGGGASLTVFDALGDPVARYS